MMMRTLAAMVVVMVISGCTSLADKHDPLYAPVEPMPYPEVAANGTPGAIYQAGNNITLFEDVRARQVGDIVTVILSEATDAAKSSDTSLDKSNSNSLAAPILGSSTVDLNAELSSEQGFAGESESNQSNSLQGSIAVTVARVLPNGNLFVQGEKWIHINQGNEYIRLRGIIRPVDISATNTVLSTKVADARISYGGTGSTAEVNGVGWLSRFFMSPLWPF